MIHNNTLQKEIRKYTAAKTVLFILFLATFIIAGIIAWRIYTNGVTIWSFIGLAVLAVCNFMNGRFTAAVEEKKSKLMEVYENE